MGSVQKILRHPHSHKKAATKPTLRIQHTRPENPLPLCVDLDGSLLRSDILIESILILFKRAPLDAFSLIFSLSLGKAHFKQEVARRACPDVRFLPYNLELLKFLKTEKASGRRILLVTGAHRLHAEAVAQHLQLFDAIIATDQNVNCVGPTKLKLIEGRLGPKNFIYVGNSADDLYVWQGAAEAITADLRASLLADLAKICTIQKEIKSSPPSWLHILRALRVHHFLLCICQMTCVSHGTGPSLHRLGVCVLWP